MRCGIFALLAIRLLLSTPATLAAQLDGAAPKPPQEAAKTQKEAAAPAKQPDGPYPDAAINKALEQFKAGDHAGALKALQSAVDANSEYPPAQVMMAQWFAEANLPAMMRGALERAVAESPVDPEAYVLLSDLALREGRLAEAELLLYRSYHLLETFRGSPRRKSLLVARTLANLASVAEAREEWTTAQKYLDAWLGVQPENVMALQRLGQVLFRLGKSEEALKRFQLAAKLDQGVLAPQAIMARLYEQSGQHEKAMQAMDAALRAAPNDVRTLVAAAQWMLETGQLAEARKQADEALKLNPDSFEAKHVKALAALFERRYAEAEQLFEAAVKQAPTSFAATNNLAIALAEQDDPAKRQRAVQIAEANLKQFPRQPETHTTLGWVLYQAGRREEAERALRTAMASGTIGPDTAYFLARIGVDQGRKPEARKLLESAVGSRGMFLHRKEAQELLNATK